MQSTVQGGLNEVYTEKDLIRWMLFSSGCNAVYFPCFPAPPHLTQINESLWRTWLAVTPILFDAGVFKEEIVENIRDCSFHTTEQRISSDECLWWPTFQLQYRLYSSFTSHHSLTEFRAAAKSYIYHLPLPLFVSYIYFCFTKLISTHTSLYYLSILTNRLITLSVVIRELVFLTLAQFENAFSIRPWVNSLLWIHFSKL